MQISGLSTLTTAFSVGKEGLSVTPSLTVKPHNCNNVGGKWRISDSHSTRLQDEKPFCTSPSQTKRVESLHSGNYAASLMVIEAEVISHHLSLMIDTGAEINLLVESSLTLCVKIRILLFPLSMHR